MIEGYRDNRPNRIIPPQANVGHFAGELSAGIARTQGRRYAESAANATALFPAADNYLQYPARNFADVYQGPTA